MRQSLYGLLFFSLLGAGLLLGEDKKPPSKLVLHTGSGDVSYDHASHAKREMNVCVVCHPRLFTRDRKAPIEYSSPHKKREDMKMSCGSCHRAEGVAFESKGNCTNGKCHASGG
ncbi:cytochrome c3 family protein [Paludibaculum fermentans]|uniref:cytochrome c3 family protein n=1 Tax=Paludibaculum fermentans TaxID=1473598 RepID=UPI003EB6A7B6